MVSVLVLGGTGKTGFEVVKALLSRGGVRVRVATRHPLQANDQEFQSFRFDWDDEATWESVIADIDALYLVKPKTVAPAKTVASFVTRFSNIRHLVLLSEIPAEKQDTAADELRVENVIESCAIGWTILRPNWFMQNFAVPSYFGGSIRMQHSVTLPTSGQAISFVDTRDIASAAAAALLENGMTGNTTLSLGQKPSRYPRPLAKSGPQRAI